MKSKNISPYSWWWESAIAMNAAATTVAVRTMRIQQAMLRGDLSGGSEASLMVSEKAEAAQQGYFAGMAALSKLVAASWPAAPDFWPGAMKVARAASRPGYATARANAKRLTGGR
ncbi:MAG: hypothetical protein RIE56_13725 [Amphiplicatus sp.]